MNEMIVREASPREGTCTVAELTPSAEAGMCVCDCRGIKKWNQKGMNRMYDRKEVRERE